MNSETVVRLKAYYYDKISGDLVAPQLKKGMSTRQVVVPTEYGKTWRGKDTVKATIRSIRR